MHIRGALHVHSTFSHDGTMTIPELAAWYRARDYQFVAIGEHSQDLDDAKIAALRKGAAENSDTRFLIIPGIEYSCRGGLHVFGMAVTDLIKETDPAAVAKAIAAQGGFAILAHPRRYQWKIPRDVLLAVNAVEIWNMAYDGKYLPAPQSLREFRAIHEVNPNLLAIAGHDFHRREAFYNVGIEMEVDSLSAEGILGQVREGSYHIKSRFFSADARLTFSSLKVAWLKIMGSQISAARSLRNFILRVSG